MKNRKSELFFNKVMSLGDILTRMFGEECFKKPDAAHGAATDASINREQKEKERRS